MFAVAVQQDHNLHKGVVGVFGYQQGYRSNQGTYQPQQTSYQSPPAYSPTSAAASDQPRAMYLVELALDFCQRALAPGGDFLVKMFQGEGSDAYIKILRQQFERVLVRKPRASRPRSREVYLLARGFQGTQA